MQERRSVMAVEGDPIKVSNRRAEREANKAFEKAKLGADTTYLDSEVLSWSFASLSDDRPPFDLRTLKKVPLEFPSIASYRDIFRPLLFLECWEQLSNAKEELGDSAEPLVMRLEAVASVDRFLEITFAVQTKEFKLNSVGENDLVNCVLRPDDGSSSSVAFMGRVISTSMRKDETRTVLKALGGHLLPSLRTQSAWAVTRLMSLTTVHREYAAMLALEYFPLRDEILRPKKGGPPKVDMERIQEVREAYGVNGPQAEVIATVLGASSGFTLCQGPPGTGKTKMILALIASLVKEYRSGAGPAPSKVSINSARKGTHLLVCAPSNAGCDEIVRRLKAGINLPNGETLKIKVVRVGTSDAVHPENLDVFLDNLVQEALLQSDEYQKLPQKDSNKAELNSVQASLRKVREEIDALEAAKKAADPDSEEMVEARVQLREALDRKRALLAKQENARGVASEAEARLAGLKKETRVRILEEADAVLCTLSASGQDMFPQLSQAFQTVIIDEAAQAVELSALIPLKYGAVRCVLVGDPQQLPPTVLSRHAIDLSYEQSLFERLRSAGHYSHLLSIQYRMHPDISVFPSTFFYESRLQDGPGLSLSTRREWHEWLGPYVFFCVEGREASSGHSLYNAREADAAVALVDSLLNRYLRLNFSSRIGIVSPYKKQVGEIKRRLRERYGKDVLNYLDVNSVDGFQGQEKDIIIFSCVRAGSDRGIGFLKDLRRLNVG
ncbi:AAA domain-containing protein [Hyaloraphidium curvatum]|nr:AAA domain-containing protein [Hyaloraphidium curvatum]